MNSGIPGAQSPARLVQVLQLVADHHVPGVSIAELTNLSGLDRSTARRMLMVLALTGFAAKDAGSGRYRLGVQAMHTGLAAMAKPPVFEACQPAMKNIARRTGDSVFLIIRVGDFAHCLHVQIGDKPLHAHSLMTGQIRLLGQGTASLALAATLKDRELAQIHERRQLDYEAAGISLQRLMDMVQQTRALGHSVSNNLLTTGASGIGVPIKVQSSHKAAISVAADAARMTPRHQSMALEILKAELEQSGIVVSKYGSLR
ncbi:helix-turn-helix domain-containing protein [Diaphorobacter sp. HDW4A]|nr:helix-turn-helix domain-containing protein [Diaphorobacter sp. HDW4A]